MPSLSNRQGPAMWLPGTTYKFTQERTTLKPIRYNITAQTLDGITGSPVGNCTVEVYETMPGVVAGLEPKGRLVNMGTSDANGNYSLDVHSNPAATFFVKAYLAGGTDKMGVTVNTLTAAIT